MAKSNIEWTEMTWNPTTGCNKISAGCKYCYAEVMAKRLKGMGLPKYKNGFKITLHEDTLSIPFTWKKPKMVFVNSMSDLFHKDIPISFIKKVFKTMNQNTQHIFQVLTKRSDRLTQISNKVKWTKNIWMGVTVENSIMLNRIEDLKSINAYLKFISCEPLIGPLSSLNLNGIDWVIVGGESGRSPRMMKKEWILEIQRTCDYYKTPFFFKQWGGRSKKKSGRLLDGKTYCEMPLNIAS